MKSIFEEIQEKVVAKNQIERLKRCIDIRYALLKGGKSLVSASEIEDARTEYQRVVSHAEAQEAGKKLLGVIAEFVLNHTLSGIEEDGAWVSQRSKPLLKRLGWPDVVAIEANVLPAERGNVAIF